MARSTWGERGVLLTYHSVNGGKELLKSPNTHLTEGHNPLLLETERESTGRKQGQTERGTTGDKTQGETGVRYCRDTCIWVLRLHRRTRQQGENIHSRLYPTHRPDIHTNTNMSDTGATGVQRMMT